MADEALTKFADIACVLRACTYPYTRYKHMYAEYSLFYRALLQKRSIIVSILLIVGTPYTHSVVHIHIRNIYTQSFSIHTAHTRSCQTSHSSILQNARVYIFIYSKYTYTHSFIHVHIHKRNFYTFLFGIHTEHTRPWQTRQYADLHNARVYISIHSIYTHTHPFRHVHIHIRHIYTYTLGMHTYMYMCTYPYTRYIHIHIL